MPKITGRFDRFQNFFFYIGIFNESGIAELLDLNILENIKEEEELKWNRKHNVSIIQYLRNSMLNFVGKSLHEFLR